MKRADIKQESISLTDELLGRFLTVLECGGGRDDALAICSVPEEAFMEWKRKGEQDLTWSVPPEKSIERRFVEGLAAARHKFKVFNLQTIIKSARKGSWQAAAWLLEREFPDEFVKREPSPVVSKDIPTVQIKFIDNDEAAQQRVKDMEKLVSEEINGKPDKQ